MWTFFEESLVVIFIVEKDLQIQNTSNNSVVEKLQSQLSEQTNQRNEFEKSLNLSKRVIEERFEREKNALQKVQEALAIAETAVADKEEAQKREQVVKEECDNLASTIGQVMDEAARKVEQDMEALKKKFSEKEKFLLEKQTKVKHKINFISASYLVLGFRLFFYSSTKIYLIIRSSMKLLKIAVTALS